MLGFDEIVLKFCLEGIIVRKIWNLEFTTSFGFWGIFFLLFFFF